MATELRREAVTMSESQRLIEGHCYLVEETSHSKSFELFAEIVSNGVKGMCISREYPDIVTEKYGLKDVPIYWLCHSVGDRRIEPKRLGILGREIIKFMRQNHGNVILLEGLEYLIIHNDFQKVMRTIHSICEAVMQYTSLLIIPINPDALNKRELALLERNMEVIDFRNNI